MAEEVVYVAQPRDLRLAGDTPIRDQFLEHRKHSMQKHQCLPLGTSPILPFLRVAAESPLGNIAPDPALISPFLAPPIILLMSRSAAPLQAPLVAMKLDLQSLRQDLKAVVLLLTLGTA